MSPHALALDTAPLLTVTQVAHILQVSKTTVYRLVDDGTLPATRLNNCLCIPSEALRDYLTRP